jgi:hypothetical protein
MNEWVGGCVIIMKEYVCASVRITDDENDDDDDVMKLEVFHKVEVQRE